MDQLSYNYKKDKPNQLLRVDEAVIAATDADDIKDQYDENYVYNDIGQLIYDFENVSKEDKDKINNQNTIPEDLITYFYNASGLVTKVNVGTAPLIEFFYNDKNHRVRKQAYYNYRDGGLPYVEHYVRDASGTVMAIYRDSKVLEHMIMVDHVWEYISDKLQEHHLTFMN